LARANVTMPFEVSCSVVMRSSYPMEVAEGQARDRVNALRSVYA